MGLCNQTRK